MKEIHHRFRPVWFLCEKLIELKYIYKLSDHMNLDNVQGIKELDKAMVHSSLGALSSQIRQVGEDKENIRIPSDYSDVNKIVVNGMGGSNLGARIISSVFKDSLQIPMVIEPGYEVPGFTDEKTLYLLSSYSGSTEETLSVYDNIKKRGAKVIAITAENEGNKLKRLMEENDIPGFVFDPRNNPAGQPRLALGYSIFGIIALLSKTGVISLRDSEVNDVVSALDKQDNVLSLESPASSNQAKQAASRAKGKKLIIVGAEFLEGNIHAMRNQICENSKNFSHYFSLPEMNHYLLEGLRFPEVNKDDLFFLFMNSDLYNPRVVRRAELTRQVAEKHGIDVMEFKPAGASKLIQSFEVLQFGSWVSFYLAMANGIDPAPIPWVDWFKEKLG